MNLGLLLSIQKDAPTPDEQYENVSEDEAYAGYVDIVRNEKKMKVSNIFASVIALFAGSCCGIVSYLFLLDCYYLPFSFLLAVGSFVLIVYGLEKLNKKLVDQIPQFLRLVSCSGQERVNRLGYLLLWSLLYLALMTAIMHLCQNDDKLFPWYSFCQSFRAFNYFLFEKYLPFIPIAPLS
jgi:hypothetical protein